MANFIQANHANYSTDILFEIFSHLPFKDLKTVNLVCKLWKTAAADNKLWKSICAQYLSSYELEISKTPSSYWKNKYKTEIHPWLCSKTSETTLLRQVYDDYYGVWFNKQDNPIEITREGNTLIAYSVLSGMKKILPLSAENIASADVNKTDLYVIYRNGRIISYNMTKKTVKEDLQFQSENIQYPPIIKCYHDELIVKIEDKLHILRGSNKKTIVLDPDHKETDHLLATDNYVIFNLKTVSDTPSSVLFAVHKSNEIMIRFKSKYNLQEHCAYGSYLGTELDEKRSLIIREEIDNRLSSELICIPNSKRPHLAAIHYNHLWLGENGKLSLYNLKSLQHVGVIDNYSEATHIYFGKHVAMTKDPSHNYYRLYRFVPKRLSEATPHNGTKKRKITAINSA